jgi:hypothetical protein
MQTWQEVVRAYDHEKKMELLRTRKVTCSQFAVVSILMYLIMGEDWPYNMAKNFEVLSDGPLSRLSGIGILTHPSNLGYLLEKMETDGLVIGRWNEIEVRRHHYYRLNPSILKSPSCSVYQKSDGSIFEIPLELIDKFLISLSYDDGNRKKMIKSWEYITKFEFLSFMIFVEDLTKEDPKSMPYTHIEEYIQIIEGPVHVDTPPSAGYSYSLAKSKERKKQRMPYSRAASNCPYSETA